MRPTARPSSRCGTSRLRRNPARRRLSRRPALAERNAVGLAFCRAHVRRRFDELARSGPAPSATEALAFDRRHALFAGSDGGGEPWATIASLIETCKLNGVVPFAYLAGVIARIVAGHPQTKLDNLLPRADAPEPPKAAA
jgi:hypothetical protein